MPNECSECGAKLESEQNECPYCGTQVYNADEQLLTELSAVARKHNEALMKGNRLEVEKLLADEYKSRLLDNGSEVFNDKKEILQNTQVNKNFVSYNLYEAELIERKNDSATIHCIQSFTDRYVLEEGTVDSYFMRGTISFVRRGGRWLIISEDTVSIDENGKEISF